MGEFGWPPGIEGRCIKHYMGAAGVKVYDKFSRVLRVETTVNDVSFFKHHRKVEHKDRHSTRELAPLGSMPFRVERNDLISPWPGRTDERADA